MTMPDGTTTISLPGLDGSNPLGFLAALGTVRAVTLHWPQHRVKMVWTTSAVGWRPELHIHPALDQNVLLSGLNDFLQHSVLLQLLPTYEDLTIPVMAFREAGVATVHTITSADRTAADFLAALGSEVIEARVNGKKNGLIADTALRTMSGAGHQHFIGFMRQLIAETETAHLCSALFHPWIYADPGPSLRWDPIDDRRYALRWRKPSGDPLMTVRGANRLAIEALPLLPTIPVNTRLETTGFIQHKGQGTIWSWPLWDTPIGLDEIRSVLSHPMLKNEMPDRHALLAIGVIEIYRCRRITQGKYRNFTPARPV